MKTIYSRTYDVSGGNLIVPATDTADHYLLSGTAAGAFDLSHSGSPTVNTGCLVESIATYGGAVTIFGVTVPATYASLRWRAYCIYSTSWRVYIYPDLTQSQVIATAQIANAAVGVTQMANLARGSVLIGDASNRPAAVSGVGVNKILVGTATDLASVSLSGAITVDATGVTTIANDYITNAMVWAPTPGNGIAYSKLTLTGSILNADINASAAIAFTKLAGLTRGYILRGSSTGVVEAHNAKTNGYILVGDGNDIKSVQSTGDVIIANTGASAIQSQVVKYSHITKEEDSGRHYGALVVHHIQSPDIDTSYTAGTVGLFSVATGDIILRVVGYTKTIQGGASTFNIGGDPAVMGGGASTAAFLKSADGNVKGIYASDDPAGTYWGASLEEGGFVVQGDGELTMTCSTAVGNWVGGIVVYMLKA